MCNYFPNNLSEMCKPCPYLSLGALPSHFGKPHHPYLIEIKGSQETCGFSSTWPFGKSSALLSTIIVLSADGEWKLKKVLVPSSFMPNAAAKRALLLLAIIALVFACSPAVRADDITDPDPVGFCPPPATVPACTTASPVGHTIAVGSTSIGMEKNGSGMSASPWFLLVAVPNYSGSAPTLSIAGFTEGAVNSATYLPSASGSIYALFGIVGDSSMRASNMFGSIEAAAFGSTPTSFDVFEYSFTGPFDSWTPYTITVGGTGLSAGTFLAASGGSQPFSTPFTTTGLVNGPTVPTPEPGSLTFLGAGLLGLAVLAGRRSLTA
jgi:hypothetical protein